MTTFHSTQTFFPPPSSCCLHTFMMEIFFFTPVLRLSLMLMDITLQCNAAEGADRCDGGGIETHLWAGGSVVSVDDSDDVFRFSVEQRPPVFYLQCISAAMPLVQQHILSYFFPSWEDLPQPQPLTGSDPDDSDSDPDFFNPKHLTWATITNQSEGVVSQHL